jgi:hypothetical protein
MAREPVAPIEAETGSSPMPFRPKKVCSKGVRRSVCRLPRRLTEKLALDLSGIVRRRVRSLPSHRSEGKAGSVALRRAEGAELDGESADRAIITVTAMRIVVGHCPRGVEYHILRISPPRFVTKLTPRSWCSP